uniref:Kelch repeat protein n=1 Tax=Rhabditophanes sp. KR3021 TaxID=114890 RepID=A0AC35UCX2_9BILA
MIRELKIGCDDSSVVIDNVIYVTPGSIKNKSMLRFDVITRESVVLETEIDNINYAFSTSKYDGQIWTFGGCVNGKIVDIVQSFDFEKMIWLEQKALPFVSSYHSSVVINNVIYVTPGNSRNKNMFRYDPRIKTWEKLAEIPIKKQNAAVCLNGNNIMYCGGMYNEGEKWISNDNCEIYEVKANKWRTTTSLPVTCWGNRSVELSTEIISFGGYSNNANISDIYSFDKKTEIWTKSNIKLPSPNCLFSLSFY